MRSQTLNQPTWKSFMTAKPATFRSFPRRIAVLGMLSTIFCAIAAHSFPISSVTFRDHAPFKGSTAETSLTSADALLTIRGWADLGAATAADLNQWWWILGVNSGVGNGALVDGVESMTLQFDPLVGASHICFLYTGNSAAPSTPARVAISGFTSDPGAYATIWQNTPLISNLSYTEGNLTFDYLYDAGGAFGQLLFANPAAAAGQTLKISYAGASGGAALFRVDSSEIYGSPRIEPLVLRQNVTNRYTTPDGKVTVRGYSDAGSTPANFGSYVDQCFGIFGGGNNEAIDGAETVILQFAPDAGLSEFQGVYNAGRILISGFSSDPGFTDPTGAAFGAEYADGVQSFYSLDGGLHRYFFVNRAASAGRTLNINADTGGSVAVAGIGYANLKTLVGVDVVPSYGSSHTTADGQLTLQAFSDTAELTPAILFRNVDWFGIAGGANDEAIDGTESLTLQFAAGEGLASFGTRYTSGGIVISGFSSDPGFFDPSGATSNASYSGGVLSYTLHQPHAPELIVRFTNPSASAGRTLSLHTDGAPGSQIALTRIEYAPAAATVKISIARAGDKAVVTWPIGTLQQSIGGLDAWQDVVGAASPFSASLSAEPRFFRVKISP